MYLHRDLLIEFAAWALTGARVGQRSLSVTADTYTHVLLDDRELSQSMRRRRRDANRDWNRIGSMGRAVLRWRRARRAGCLKRLVDCLFEAETASLGPCRLPGRWSQLCASSGKIVLVGQPVDGVEDV